MSDFPYPNHERLDNVIKGIERKYFFSGERSFSGKHESIALVLSRCISFKENDLISLRDIASMQKIDNPRLNDFANHISQTLSDILDKL